MRAIVAVTVAATASVLSGCVGDDGGPASPPPTVVTTAPTPTPSPTPSRTPTPAPSATETPEPTPTAEPAEPAAASVEIVNSSYDPSTRTVSAAAMVTNVVSETGVCTLIATQGSAVVSAQAPGRPDAAVTYCASLAVVLPEGATGTWSVSIGYTDATSTGNATTEVAVS